ncbi:hypothetical protein DTO027B5_595 [Paecilomyces variotii]|nr:hypothetical protein DTO027B3_6206 [Paecilomyces variotii]KAJ9337774.1 hypothetical protein DTO027B5_595 [Paecilomyces variotii]KAJ9388793.1 hypothetical protein DTO063F5_2441 [Paecilomyces variotii]
MVPYYQSRNSIEDIWGSRQPYKHQWPQREDAYLLDEPDKWVQSACVLCSNGCGLDIGVKDGKVVGVRGRVVDRVNKGRLGPKGLNGWTAINHPDRLTHPLIRKNGKLVKTSWDEAMSLIVEKAKDIRRRLTSHGIAFYTSGQLFLEEYYALAMIGKAGLNALHMDGNTRLCTATAAASMRESFGSDGQPGSYADVDYTDCLFIVGHNVSATQTVLWARILDRLDGPNPPKLIVVDPRKSETAKRVTVHLAPKIGTNVAVLNGIEHLMYKNGWIDDDWVTKHTVGSQELKETVEKYTPEFVEQITGVPKGKLEEAAQIIGTTKTMLSTALQGVYQSNQATAAACQINNINLLRGLIGRPGSGILQMNGQPTAQNNREAGCDGEFPGFRNFQNPNHIKEIADVWNIDPLRVPHWAEPTHIENMLTYIDEGSIEMFWVSGTNPLVSLPNLTMARKCLTKPDLFVICQDIYLTETAQIADVVLPAAQWGEKTGCFTNADRTVHLSHKAVNPPGEARADLDIFLDFGRRMDFKDKDGNDLLPFSTPEEVFCAWKKLSKGRPCDYSGLSYEKLTGGSGIQWPCNDTYPYGKERLFDDAVFFTDIDYCESFGHDLETGAPLSKEDYQSINPGGRAILKSANYFPDPEEPNENYPIRLSTGRNVYHFHTRTKTGRSKPLQEACPEPTIRISKDDAVKFNVQDGDEVVVRSRRGAVEMRASVGDIAPGQAFIPFHFGYFDSTDGKSRAANELTIERWDPISKQPTFKSGAVRIEKIEPGQVKIHAREQHSASVRKVQTEKPTAQLVKHKVERTRRLELWLGTIFEAIQILKEICSQLIPTLIHDMEIRGGMKVMERIAESIQERLAPVVDTYKEQKVFGESVSRRVRDNLFPALDRNSDHEPYEALTALQAFYMYLCHIDGHLVALHPASQAMWDENFFEAVKFSQQQITRMKSWTTQQMKTKAPQRLLVPMDPTDETVGSVFEEDARKLADSLRA